MQNAIEWLRKRHWAAFLGHQLFVFGIAVSFLTIVRSFTGRSIHLGQDPVGLIDGLALAVLSVVVILLINWFYGLIKESDGPTLGISLSIRRGLDLMAGFVAGAVLFAVPWLISIWRGSAFIADNIGLHFDLASAIAMFFAACLLLLLQAIMEETVNRAFPMQLWHSRSIAFRLLVPAVPFVLIHLISETSSTFDTGRLFVLLTGSFINGLAYALTENIWLASGLHFGANIASYSMSGMWHAGAVVSINGQPAIPVLGVSLIMLGILAVIYGVKQARPSKSSISLSASA